MATKMTREEAIKIVQSATVWTDEERDALSMLIPELAESEDERIRRWLCDYFSSIDKAWIHKDITCIDILRWLEKQKEQKPAEWSEEDENMAYFVNQFLEYHENADPTAKSCKKWFNNRLKFLPWNLKKKNEDVAKLCSNEWSEEDENVYKTIMDDFNGITPMSKAYKLKAADWLKSLRPSWKPNEEQMKALDIYRKVPLKYSIDREMLDSLYEQLKKL